MSISASIDIILKKFSSLTAVCVINTLLENGWKMEKENKVSFLPLNDNGMYEWKNENIQKYDLIQIIEQKEIEKEVIGLVFYWKDTNIGISMLIFSCNEISFNLNINRIKLELDTHADITDVSWYLKRIMPCFSFDEIILEKLFFNQD